MLFFFSSSFLAFCFCMIAPCMHFLSRADIGKPSVSRCRGHSPYHPLCKSTFVSRLPRSIASRLARLIAFAKIIPHFPPPFEPAGLTFVQSELTFVQSTLCKQTGPVERLEKRNRRKKQGILATYFIRCQNALLYRETTHPPPADSRFPPIRNRGTLIR